MVKIAKDITKLIGNIPMVKLNRVNQDIDADVVVKLEFFNPCNSVKDRIGVSMIKDAEDAGRIREGTLISEMILPDTGERYLSSELFREVYHG